MFLSLELLSFVRNGSGAGSSKDGRLYGVAGSEEAWTSPCLFLAGTVHLKSGASKAINLSLLTSAYSHLHFSESLNLKMSFQ